MQQTTWPRLALDAESDTVLSPDQVQQQTRYQIQIEQAIAKAQAVQIRYYSASDDRVSKRVIEPMRLEQRGTVGYVLAYCQQANAERIFRLDWICALNTVFDGPGEIVAGET